MSSECEHQHVRPYINHRTTPYLVSFGYSFAHVRIIVLLKAIWLNLRRAPRASSDIPRSGDPDLKLESPSPISDSEDPERGIEPQSLPPNSAD
jgi:hypothetical protein